jgi:hypothetical protein
MQANVWQTSSILSGINIEKTKISMRGMILLENFCKQKSKLDSICQSLSCRVTANSSCVDASEGAKEGTLCASGKVSPFHFLIVNKRKLYLIMIVALFRFVCREIVPRVSERPWASAYLAMTS